MTDAAATNANLHRPVGDIDASFAQLLPRIHSTASQAAGPRCPALFIALSRQIGPRLLTRPGDSIEACFFFFTCSLRFPPIWRFLASSAHGLPASGFPVSLNRSDATG